MTQARKNISSTTELAKALSVLNGRVEPAEDLVQQRSSRHDVSADFKMSAVKPERFVAVQHAGGLLIAVELNGIQDPVLAKLFDLSSKVPLLASAGNHVPGSLSGKGKQIFIHVFGQSPKSGVPLGVELLFKDKTQLKFKLEVQSLRESSSKLLLDICGAGTASFGQLLEQDLNKKSSLHAIAAHLVKFERSIAPKFIGKVDGVIGGVIEGWFWNPAEPKKRYELQAWIGEKLVGYARANLWREDLEKAGKDDGKVKFELRVSNILNDGETHLLQVKVFDPDTCQMLINLGEPLKYQHLNKSFSLSIKPQIMDATLNGRLLNALLKKANVGLNGPRIKSDFLKIFLHLESLEYKQARGLIEQQMQSGFDNGFSRTKLAETYVIEQDYAKAAEIYRMVIAKAKDFVWSYSGLGFVLDRMGLKADAIVVYQELLKISPSMKDVFEKVSRLQSELEMDSASDTLSPVLVENLIKHSQRALLSNPDDYALSEKIHSLELTLKKMAGVVFSASTTASSKSLALRRLQHARIYLQSCINHAK